MDRIKTHARILSVCAGLIALGISACGGSNGNDDNAPANNESAAVLAISSLPRLDPFPTTVEEITTVFNEAFDLAYNAYARGQMTTKHWSELEPQSGVYDNDAFDSLNDAIDNAQAHGMQQFVGLQLINTTQREMPSDLAAVDFDDARVIAQFKLLLDRSLAGNANRIRYLSIGNEVDVYLRANPTQWSKYVTFYAEIADYIHERHPDIAVGVTTTAEGALTLSSQEIQQLNTTSDVIILTYYPLDFAGDGTVTVRAPDSPIDDFTAMTEFAGARKIVLQEVGYPASPLNSSSQAMQAAFVDNAFTAWRQHVEQIPFLNYFVLHDFTSQMCDEFTQYYGAGNLQNAESFAAYLCSLGLRESNGTPRQAWDTLIDAANAADFIQR